VAEDFDGKPEAEFGWPLGIGLFAGVIALVVGFREFYS